MKAEFSLIAMCVISVSGCSSSVRKPETIPSVKVSTRTMSERMPQPVYNTREGKFDGLPSVMIVSQALKGYKFKADFPWYLHIDIAVQEQNPAELPTQKEAKVLNALEDKITAALNKVCRNHYIGRTSWKGRREIFFYLDSPKEAHRVLLSFTSTKKPIREFEYEMSEDKNWSNVDFLFDY